MKKLLNAVFKIQSQTTGWMHTGKERAKHNTVKLYMKTERLQEEGGSILGIGMEPLPRDTGRHSTN